MTQHDIDMVKRTDQSVFDDIVIGSSPMMLLQAGMLAREGRRVCLVEREERIGGSWQTATLENGEEVEIACHLIEVFPGIYEFLEGAAGAPFEALHAQPIRVHPTGFIFPYFSRILMLASGIRLLLGCTSERLKTMFVCSKNKERLINFEKKLSSFVKYQGPAFFQHQAMQGPKHGFVDFMDRLIARTKSDGVEIRHVDVTSLVRPGDGFWHVNGAEGTKLQSEHVHCTTSTNLRPIAPGRFEAKKQDFAHRLCVVARVRNEDIKVSQTYVAFWNDPNVARISRIDEREPRPYQHFLVEFHNQNAIRSPRWHQLVRSHMEWAKVVEKDGEFEVVGHVDCVFTTNIDQLPSGEIDTNLWGYYSMGNLAAGLSAWRKFQRVPPLKHRETLKRVA